ncbi:PIN domain-containing protein [Polaribacter uvawellassae]|uniref:PIN domain-containing protein n=1 Tax=Polaribacter uvawellassae TaxID=3133495 RepID=UPI00321A5D8E
MNIFIDTSVIYKDPFWKGNFFSELIDIVKEKEIGLYISDVVLMEIERNYGKIVDQQIFQLSKAHSEIDHYQMSLENESIIDKDKSIKGLKSHYKKLIDEGILTLLKYSNEMMPEIVNRAVYRKKPFTETKTELKDTIIWLTYAEHAEKQKLKDCILLTNNVSDFCDTEKLKEKIFEIHPDLQKDSKRFKVYKSPKELIQNEKSTLQFITQRFGSWLEEQEFDNQFVLELLKENFEKEIKDRVEREYENLNLDDVFREEDYYLDGYVSPGFIEITDVDAIEIDTFNDECIISGQVFISCDVEGYQYNPVRDKGEDRYNYFGELTNVGILTFSFYYDKSEIPRSLNLDDYEIVE